MDALTLAKAVRTAAKIREDSWNREREAYDVLLDCAVKSAFIIHDIDDDLVLPFQLAFQCWNDLLDWADRVIRKHDS